jgi:hypothetical protein
MLYRHTRSLSLLLFHWLLLWAQRNELSNLSLKLFDASTQIHFHASSFVSWFAVLRSFVGRRELQPRHGLPQLFHSHSTLPVPCRPAAAVVHS